MVYILDLRFKSINFSNPNQDFRNESGGVSRAPFKSREGASLLLLPVTLLPCEQVEDNREYRVHVIMPVVASSVFRNSRSVLVRRTLDQGRYVVVACTFEPGVIGSYLFRVYTGSSTKVR